MSILFEDLNEYDGKHTEFPACNENIDLWRKVLKDVRVDNAGVVCSGGEVAFFAILPCVRKRMEAIDHAYGSMYYALGKYHIIEKLGSKQAHKLFNEYHEGPFKELLEEANRGLPTRPATRAYSGTSPSAVTKILRKLTQKDLTEFRANREKVRFVHGDLNDLVERGPFDLVYLSNALEYNGRNGYEFNVKGMVKPGGYLALAASKYRNTEGRYLRGFKLLANEKMESEYPLTSYSYRPPDPRRYGLGWEYRLYQVPA